jgi:hypothetical protein
MRTVALLLFVLATGIGIGVVLTRGSATAVTGAQASRAAAERPVETFGAHPVVINAGGRVDEAGLRGVIRDVLRDELKGARADEARSATASPAPTVENIAAHDKGLQLIASARARGDWTHEDAQALRQQMPQMTQEERDEVLHTLLPALNRGELKIDFRDMPF